LIRRFIARRNSSWRSAHLPVLAAARGLGSHFRFSCRSERTKRVSTRSLPPALPAIKRPICGDSRPCQTSRPPDAGSRPSRTLRTQMRPLIITCNRAIRGLCIRPGAHSGGRAPAIVVCRHRCGGPVGHKVGPFQDDARQGGCSNDFRD
jgi:hypothetical protein